MRRRTFLGVLGSLGAALAAGRLSRPAAAAIDRRTWWSAHAPSFGNFIILEWRCLAGRIKDSTRDFGFVVSLVDYKDISLIQAGHHELIVMRRDFTTGAHQSRTYQGALTGAAVPGDLIDATINVPAGQFIKNARVLSGNARGTPMEEGVGIAGPGTVLGQALTAITLNVGERTFTAPEPTYMVNIPLVPR